jgi:purine-cytosine permease-like protein
MLGLAMLAIGSVSALRSPMTQIDWLVVSGVAAAFCVTGATVIWIQATGRTGRKMPRWAWLLASVGPVMVVLAPLTAKALNPDSDPGITGALTRAGVFAFLGTVIVMMGVIVLAAWFTERRHRAKAAPHEEPTAAGPHASDELPSRD